MLRYMTGYFECVFTYTYIVFLRISRYINSNSEFECAATPYYFVCACLVQIAITIQFVAVASPINASQTGWPVPALIPPMRQNAARALGTSHLSDTDWHRGNKRVLNYARL